MPHIEAWVRPDARLVTDTAGAFVHAKDWYDHETVNHQAGEYVRDEFHTNSIEAYWANLKRGIKGTYVWVSKRHLQKYLWEFEFRHNLRNQPHLMFEFLLQAFPR